MIDMGALLRGVTQVVEAEGRLLLAEFNAPTGPRGSHASAPIDVEIVGYH